RSGRRDTVLRAAHAGSKRKSVGNPDSRLTGLPGNDSVRVAVTEGNPTREKPASEMSQHERLSSSCDPRDVAMARRRTEAFLWGYAPPTEQSKPLCPTNP